MKTIVSMCALAFLLVCAGISAQEFDYSTASEYDRKFTLMSGTLTHYIYAHSLVERAEEVIEDMKPSNPAYKDLKRLAIEGRKRIDSLAHIFKSGRCTKAMLGINILLDDFDNPGNMKWNSEGQEEVVAVRLEIIYPAIFEFFDNTFTKYKLGKDPKMEKLRKEALADPKHNGRCRAFLDAAIQAGMSFDGIPFEEFEQTINEE